MLLAQESLRPMSHEDISRHIRTIEDFPKPGIHFRDITPLLANPKAFDEVVSRMALAVEASGAEKIVGLESRGFIFGIAVAQKLKLPFIPARKPGKLPAKTAKISYALEYGEATLEIHEDAIQAKEKVAVVDDLLATGGTASAAGRLIKNLGGEVAGFFFAIELPALNGRQALGNGCVINALLKF